MSPRLSSLHRALALWRRDPELFFGYSGFKALGTALIYTGVLLASKAHSENADETITQFYVEDIKAAMNSHIEMLTRQDGNWHTVDDQTGAPLTLRFLQIHDPVRQISREVYFACTDFHDHQSPEQVYDMDFWLEPRDGQLIVYQTKVHKEPRHSLLYGWYKHPRYTFVNDEIEYLY